MHHQWYVTRLQNGELHDWQYHKTSHLIFSLKLPYPQNIATPEYTATFPSPALLTTCWRNWENFNLGRIKVPHISLNPAGPLRKEKWNNCLVFWQNFSTVTATSICITAVPMMSRHLQTNMKDLALPQCIAGWITWFSGWYHFLSMGQSIAIAK